MLVAATVVVGARVLAAADDTVQVWAAAADLGAGQRVEADDLVAQRVRFADDGALAGYFTVDDELPADLELTRSVAAGELLPRGAVGTPDETGLVEVPDRGRARARPARVAPGDVVDVYVVAPISADADGQAQAAAADGPGAHRCHRRRRTRARLVVRHQRQAPARARRARGGRAGVLRPPRPLRRPSPHRGPARMKRRPAARRRRRPGRPGRSACSAAAATSSSSSAASTSTTCSPRPRPARPTPPWSRSRRPGFDLAAVDHLRASTASARSPSSGERARHGAGHPDRRPRHGPRRRPRGAARRRSPPTASPHPSRRPTPDDPPASQGRVIAVWGPAGAPGRTTVATALAAVPGQAGPGPRWSTPTPTAAASRRRSASSTRSPDCCRRPGSPAAGCSRNGSPRSSGPSTRGSPWSPGCPAPTAGPRSGPAPSSCSPRSRAGTATS